MVEGMILTDSQGRPIARPKREDFSSDVEFIRAFHAYKDKVAQEANQAFDSALRKALK